jgi:hypothetical protein
MGSCRGDRPQIPRVLEAHVKAHGMPVKAGVSHFLEIVDEAGIKTAVATSNDMEGAATDRADGLIEGLQSS